MQINGHKDGVRVIPSLFKLIKMRLYFLRFLIRVYILRGFHFSCPACSVGSQWPSGFEDGFLAYCDGVLVRVSLDTGLNPGVFAWRGDLNSH